MADLFGELQWRGLIHQFTDAAIPDWLRSAPRTLYAGFDPTADSLHVGHLVPLLTLRRFQRAGHRAIALVGGATGMIGDPSGKSEERQLLSAEQLERNVAGVQRQMSRFLDFNASPRGALLLNNFDWMKSYGYLDFLRDVGKNVPVNVMLSKDSVRARLDAEGGLSYTEFSYMLLQAFDFAWLYEHYECRLQIGGSDQWGNITAGIDLARRMRQVQLYGVTCPLLTDRDGKKLGKTEAGTSVWLSPERTSAYRFYQYWMQLADDDAGRCLRTLTELDRREIEELDRARAERPEARETQRRLAGELTRLVHGPAGLDAAEQATRIFFGAEIESLDEAELLDIFADVPSRELPRQQLDDPGLSLVDALVAAGLAKSKGEARRTIEQGGAYVKNRRRGAVDTRLTARDLAGGSILVLRKGKNKYALLRFR